MLSDSTPRSLAALYTRKRRGVSRQDDVPESLAPPAPPVRPGQQLGLLFIAPPDEAGEVAAPIKKEKQRRVWSVASLVADLRRHIEEDYRDEWVEGEISNVRLAPSGHLYFTLKDAEAQLPVVMFRREAAGLKFKPEDGHSVLVRGSVSVYESRGQLQLIATALEPRGEGALRLAFEQLRQKLLAEGLFDADRKRSLPRFPQTVGVITSPAGAVLRDIAHVAHRRHRCLNLLVFPALMQGTDSAAEVRAGLAYFNSAKAPKVDLILIARGGGSTEDLWGFNDEVLARAIAASNLPVVSAVGHETDFTIADFVADHRAPTPSAAAEVITEGHFRAQSHIAELKLRMDRGVRFQMLRARQQYARIDTGSLFNRMREAVRQRQQRVDTLRFDIEAVIAVRIRDSNERLLSAERRLAQQNLAARIHAQRAAWAALDQRLCRSAEAPMQRLHMRERNAAARLSALNPNAVLQRGYAFVFGADGKLVRSASQVQGGETIIARVADGEIRARVTENDTE